VLRIENEFTFGSASMTHVIAVPEQKLRGSHGHEPSGIVCISSPKASVAHPLLAPDVYRAWALLLHCGGIDL
jgi:hypothetical protein